MHLTRTLKSAAVSAALSLLLLPGVARAESVAVQLDGRPMGFDAPPIMELGRTLVPLRALLTPLGADFAWEPETQKVTASLHGYQIEAAVNSDTALVNGEAVTLEVPVRLVAGRTMLPLRFFAEELGLDVDWDPESRTAFVWTPPAYREEVASRGAERRMGEYLVTLANAAIGSPYAWGGSSPETGFDCSGFIVYLAAQVGLDLPHSSYEQFQMGLSVALEDLAAGDLLFYATYDDGASHVGIYDGEGGFIHAQNSEVGVVRTSLWNPWWSSRYLGARRVFR
jgi:hypothetical protein